MYVHVVKGRQGNEKEKKEKKDHEAEAL